MDMIINNYYAWVKPSEIRNLGTEIGRTCLRGGRLRRLTSKSSTPRLPPSLLPFRKPSPVSLRGN